MPIVTIQVTGEETPPIARVSPQKRKQRSSRTPVNCCSLHKPLEATFVLIEKVEMENWAWAAFLSNNTADNAPKSAEASTIIATVGHGGAPDRIDRCDVNVCGPQSSL